MSCAVLPNSARLEKRYDATLFGFAVLTDSEMHAKRNDAARGSNGAGKPQGPWDGAKASPWAFRFPPALVRTALADLLAHTLAFVTPLRAFFALKRRPMPWPIGTVPFGHLVPKSALVECASCTM